MIEPTLVRAARTLPLLAWSVALWSSTAAQAQTPADGGQWQWRATPYLWLPSIRASTQTYHPPGGDRLQIEANPDGYLSHLQSAFMGTIEARRGPWTLLGDLVYLNMGEVTSQVKSISGPGGQVAIPLQTKAETDLEGSIVTLAVGRAIRVTPDHETDVFAGLRFAHVSSAVTWEFGTQVAGLTQRGSAEVSKDFTDLIGGARGRVLLGGNWAIPYHLDIGAGSSRFTYQAIAGVSYRYGWGDVTLIYRHLAYDFKSDDPMSDLGFSGPALGVSFRF